MKGLRPQVFKEQMKNAYVNTVLQYRRDGDTSFYNVDQEQDESFTQNEVREKLMQSMMMKPKQNRRSSRSFMASSEVELSSDEEESVDETFSGKQRKKKKKAEDA